MHSKSKPKHAKKTEQTPTAKNLYDPLIRSFLKELKSTHDNQELDPEERKEWIRFFQQQSSDYIAKLQRGLHLLERKLNHS